MTVPIVRSIRFRITAVAAAAVAIALVIAGGSLVALQRDSLTASIDQTLRQRADDLVALLNRDGPPPTSFGGTTGEAFAQLVSPDGEPLTATPNLAGAPPLDLDSTGAMRTVTGLPVDDDAFRVFSTSVPGKGTLHVGATYDVVEESTAALVRALAVTFPALVLLAAGLVWWLVGRTLSPVERIRSEVATIGAGELHRRVPDPGTGDEVARLAGTMNAMLTRIDSALERQRRFAADASHELRSPLTRMRSTLEVDLGIRAGDPAGGPTQRLYHDVVNMQNLVDDLLHLARADAETLRMDMRPIDMDDLVLRETRRLADRGHVEVDRSGVSGAHVLADWRHLDRVVRNVLDNAERHARTRVTVSLEETGNHAVLQVADDGPGISPSDGERIFERFTRLDDARTSAGGGTGLGLAIARDIALRHGGTLELDDDESPGATFVLRLPLIS